MRSRSALRTGVVAASAISALGGCATGEADGPNEGRFDGMRKRVAAVVDELQQASRQDDVARICERIFSDRLEERFAQESPRGCGEVVRTRLADRRATFRAQSIELIGYTRAAASVVDQRGRRMLVHFFREPHAGWEITRIVQ